MVLFSDQGIIKFRQFFLISVAIILTASGALKMIGSSLDLRFLSEPDPILTFFTTRQIMIGTALVEFLFAALILFLDGSMPNCLIAWLSTNFLMYRFGLWIIGAGRCPCLGSLEAWLGISPALADYISTFCLFYLFFGSYLILFSRTLTQFTRLKTEGSF